MFFYLSFHLHIIFLSFQAFINTAKEIYEKIQEGVFDINNEVTYEGEEHSVFIMFSLCFQVIRSKGLPVLLH